MKRTSSNLIVTGKNNIEPLSKRRAVTDAKPQMKYFNHIQPYQHHSYSPRTHIYQYNTLMDMDEYVHLQIRAGQSQTVLYDAISDSDIRLVQLLFKRGVRADEASDALLLASQKGHGEIVQLLLDNGAKISSRNNFELCMALRCGHLDVAKILMNNGANLELALNYAHSETFFKLILKNSIKDESLSEAVLNWAILYDRDIYLLKFLLENGADINKDTLILSLSSVKGRADIVKLCLDYGVELKLINKYFPTFVYNNCYNERDGRENFHRDVIQLLLDYGADINANNGDALISVIESDYNNPDVVQFLLENGAKADVQNSKALRLAGNYQYIDTARLLIIHGASLAVLSPLQLDYFSREIDDPFAQAKIDEYLSRCLLNLRLSDRLYPNLYMYHYNQYYFG